jgi:hypothetical protein
MKHIKKIAAITFLLLVGCGGGLHSAEQMRLDAKHKHRFTTNKDYKAAYDCAYEYVQKKTRDTAPVRGALFGDGGWIAVRAKAGVWGTKRKYLALIEVKALSEEMTEVNGYSDRYRLSFLTDLEERCK